MDRLNCRVLYLQPLRKLKDRIPAQINSSLSRLNASRPYPVLGAEPEAVHLLQSFPWPHNYAQFQRVLEELTASSEQISPPKVSVISCRKNSTAIPIPPEWVTFSSRWI